VRAFYGMRNGRVVHTESVQTDNHEAQKRLARSRIDEFDCIEIWDGSVLCVRLRHKQDSASVVELKVGAAPAKPAPAARTRRRTAAA
jgi:hypothetical protein